jgi:acetyl esterase/lipase
MTSSPSQPAFVLILLLTLAAFGGQVSAQPLPPGTRVQRNLPYGPDPAQRLDVYSPPSAKNAPVLFMVHGGGWRRGDKAYPNVVTNKVAHWLPQGYIFISINYRLLPKANPVEQAGDVAKALAFAQNHAKSWGADPARFILMGHSAGAHLVSLVTADPTIAKRQGATPWLGTISLDSAAYNVVTIMDNRHFHLYDEAFGTNRGLWQAASPTLRLKTKTVPMLLVCSTRRLDSRPQAQAFAAKAQSLGGQATLLPEDLTHGQINANLGLPGQYTDRVDAFLHSLWSK